MTVALKVVYWVERTADASACPTADWWVFCSVAKWAA